MWLLGKGRKDNLVLYMHSYVLGMIPPTVEK